jgi:hypothetical protein
VILVGGDYDVQGIRETMAVLKQIDPTLQRQAVKNVKIAAESIVQDARSRIPAIPTGTTRGRPNWNQWTGNRSWNPSEVRRGIKSRVRATRGRGQYDRPLVSVVQSSAAGAIYDMAGKTRKFTRGPQGEAFNRALSRNGPASRSMWPALEAKIDEVNRSMDEAVKEMEHEINARLGGFAGISRLL